jgi:hypothetical protein
MYRACSLYGNRGSLMEGRHRPKWENLIKIKSFTNITNTRSRWNWLKVRLNGDLLSLELRTLNVIKLWNFVNNK